MKGGVFFRIILTWARGIKPKNPPLKSLKDEGRIGNSAPLIVRTSKILTGATRFPVAQSNCSQPEALEPRIP